MDGLFFKEDHLKVCCNKQKLFNLQIINRRPNIQRKRSSTHIRAVDGPSERKNLQMLFQAQKVCRRSCFHRNHEIIFYGLKKIARGWFINKYSVEVLLRLKYRLMTFFHPGMSFRKSSIHGKNVGGLLSIEDLQKIFQKLNDIPKV